MLLFCLQKRSFGGSLEYKKYRWPEGRNFSYAQVQVPSKMYRDTESSRSVVLPHLKVARPASLRFVSTRRAHSKILLGLRDTKGGFFVYQWIIILQYWEHHSYCKTFRYWEYAWKAKVGGNAILMFQHHMPSRQKFRWSLIVPNWQRLSVLFPEGTVGLTYQASGHFVQPTQPK